jgi:hypothetical protein
MKKVCKYPQLTPTGLPTKKIARFCILFQASKWKKCRQAGQHCDFHYAFTNLPLPKRPDSLSQNFKFLICQIFLNLI